MRGFIAAGVLALFLAGCASAGVKVTEDQAAGFKVGQSTYADVVAALGAPTTTTTASNGMRTAVYAYSSVQSRPQNFIPYIGPFVGGYDTQATSVAFTFDGRGVLTGTTSSQTGIGAGANLAASGVQPIAQTAQPR